jgi:multidrug resistance efflux pump
MTQALNDLDVRWQRTTQRLTAAGQGARIPQARTVRDARAAYLAAEAQVASSEIQTTRIETELSRAQLALVRQRQLARIGRVTGASLKPLEAAVVSFKANLKAATTAATAVRTRAEQGLEAWKAAEDEYARASGGDYDTVVWAE